MVEQAKYEIVRALGDVEIRRYRELIIAKVDGRDNAFDLLFRYISGNNSTREKVAMTTPVISERIEMTAPVFSDAGSLAFVMPERYTCETLPLPIDERVKIISVPQRIVASLCFSGSWSEHNFEKRTKELLDELAKAGIKTKGDIFSMLYNPPFTPWFMRRNEVAIEVEIG